MKQKVDNNAVELITYPDSLGTNIAALHQILDKYFSDAITGVHVLPFYPSSADRGFAPRTHLDVDPAFGTWADLRALATDYCVMSDLIVNHISAQSDIFRDFLASGDASPYTGYFITPEKFSRHILPYRDRTNVTLSAVEHMTNALRHYDHVFHIKGVNKYSLHKIYRPRPGNPFVTFTDASGKDHELWCTFSPDQIDLDVHSPGVIKLLTSYIHNLATHGIQKVRLDAVGYVIKKRGTTNFMIPETYAFVTKLADIAHKHDIVILPEVHGHYTYQIRLAQTPGVDDVYDFQLPLLALHALFTGETADLIHWISIRPHNIVTTLDTHDGLPIVDIEGLLTQKQTDAVVRQIKTNGGNETLRASGESANNLDIYQINCTYYSAVAEDDDAYIVARALQCFLPGTPQIYYVGLLAGSNDAELFAKTNVGRDVNRHNYTAEEVAYAMERDVVKRLLTVLRLRKTHPAFAGEFTYSYTRHTVTLAWSSGTYTCRAAINFRTKTTRLIYTDPTTGTIQKIIA